MVLLYWVGLGGGPAGVERRGPVEATTPPSLPVQRRDGEWS
jgi:hypothetical protein